MTNPLLWLSTYVVNAIWQVAVLASAAWCLSCVVKRAGPEVQHKIWVATLMLATLAPATPAVTYYFAHRAPAEQRIGAKPTAVAGLAAPGMPLRSSDLVLSPTIVNLIAGLYVAALLIGLLRLCRNVRRTNQLIHTADSALLDADHSELWHRSRERLSVPSAGLLQSQEISGPVTAGFRRPVLILPAAFLEEYSQTEFLAAIAHECAHIRRDDYRKNLFYEIAGLFTAFHPFTWFVKSRIAESREMVCDRMAAEQLADRRTYALSLLQLAGKVRGTYEVSPAMGMFDTKILERRIMSLITSMPRLSRFQRHSWTATTILLLSACAGGIGLMARSVAAQSARPTAPPSAEGKKPQRATDLTCTFYHNGVGYPGTCGYVLKNDRKQYVCYLESDSAQKQQQIGCESKVRRAEEAKK